jgi:hypothetical protein
MDNKPRPKSNQGSSWNDENETLTNPNRRQDEDSNVESPRKDQRASNGDLGSSESTESDRGEQLHSDRDRHTDESRRTRQTEE